MNGPWTRPTKIQQVGTCKWPQSSDPWKIGIGILIQRPWKLMVETFNWDKSIVLNVGTEENRSTVYPSISARDTEEKTAISHVITLHVKLGVCSMFVPCVQCWSLSLSPLVKSGRGLSLHTVGVADSFKSSYQTRQSMVQFPRWNWALSSLSNASIPRWSNPLNGLKSSGQIHPEW